MQKNKSQKPIINNISKKPSLNIGDKIHFVIERLNAQGIGIYNSDLGTVFIPQTLLGERGEAEIAESKKGIFVAKIILLDQKSQDRLIPQECPHYSEFCGGCQYLHTDYETELFHKENSLKLLFIPWFNANKLQNISIHRAPNRLQYRNRIQLHYDKNLIGHKSLFTKNILATPLCKIATESLTQYKNKIIEGWKRETCDLPSQGHVEFSEKIINNQKVFQHTFNKEYSHDGFSQVNDSMNLVLQETIRKNLAGFKGRMLDFFCGNGNLTLNLPSDWETFGFDNTNPERVSPHLIFKKLDLYGNNADLKSLLPKNASSTPTSIIVDPPRSGWTKLNEVVAEFQPECLIYVSCYPSTLKRDLQELEKTHPWKKMHLTLIDMFPSTAHFETVCALFF